MLSAEPVCSCAHFFVHIAHETAGAARTRSSLRPLYFWGQGSCKTSGEWRREKANYVRQKVVIASEAKQSIVPRKERVDCFASLAMTVLLFEVDPMVAGHRGLRCHFGS
jgi:hypothetical protein